ncbi:PREDICTED: testis-expressed sequence 2 protein isoform X3 [Ceratotherium simum simum]|uniref:Testis-expressed sequence 2 protein isoform X3 n=1 Tax=Ceratotherium simum simum TaxID=73337 RepID=A0ABM1CYL8_CERSS|nr:PREDICTED: testis-expressed sequence 2 protein isoform X3 [Ceratotherium simum simum]
MTSLNGRHAEKIIDMPKPSAPRVHVQRSVSRDTIAIHFSASGEEEEEEEEEFREYLEEGLDDQSIVTGLEAKEDLCFEPQGGYDPAGPAAQPVLADGLSPAILPVSQNTAKLLESPPPAVQVLSTVPLALSPGSSLLGPLASSPSVSSLSEQKTGSSSPLSSPSKSPVLSSSASSSTLSSTKPFMSLVKSLSTEVEPKESLHPSRHRHLMKTLVKSLSTDTSRQESDTVSYKPPDSKLNLHLFKQFTQPRNTGGDSKTAPSSPLTSPSDTRSFFKVPEMEAKIEDTKRRLSEVIYEPFQLLSKIIGEESGSHRPKALSSSASELSNLSSLNGLLESNNNYSIKEEECDSEGDDYPGDPSIPRSDPPKSTDEPAREAELKSSQVSSLKDLGLKTSSLVLEKCSLSALVSKEDEEFCELYTEDFDLETEGESKVDKLPDIPLKPEVLVDDGTALDSDDEMASAVQHPELPVKTLGFFIMCVYAYLILPLPHYVNGLFLGIGLGFMTAVCVIWFFTPPSAHKYHRLRKNLQHWNTKSLDIKEPEILKGWMNEIYNYDPETYHATLTHSVFVRLEGGTLRLSKPNKNISRRASYNEAKPEVTYVSQKIYELSDSKIYLVPKSLARKRIWNKKYPICIELGRQDDFMSKAQSDKENSEDKPPAERDLGGEDPKKPPHSQEGTRSSQRDQILYLFGRTGREKEEWFRRFILASKPKSEIKKPPGISGSKPGVLPSHSRHNSPSGHLTHSRSSSKGSVEEIMSQPKQKELVGNVRQKMLLDYSVYMARCVPQENQSPQRSPVLSAESSPTAGKKLPEAPPSEEEEQEAWVNALLGRMFWDFLGEKYWSDLVSKKIQMKLSKIKLPYFMNELTLTELDMGMAVPKILQAFKPYVDHQVAGPGRTVWPTAMRSPPVLAPLMKMMHQSPVRETNRFSQGPKGMLEVIEQVRL